MKLSDLRNRIKDRTLKIVISLTGRERLVLTLNRQQFLALSSRVSGDAEVHAEIRAEEIRIKNSLNLLGY